MYKLEDKHLEEVKKIVLKHRKKKSCGNCYERGYVGINQDNFLVPCPKCVDIDKAMEEWKEYVEKIPELKDNLPELFEEKDGEQ